MVTAMALALSSSPSAPRYCSLGFRVSDRCRYGFCGVVTGRTGLLSHGERRTSMVLSTGISPVKQLPSSSSSSSSSSLVLLLSPEYQLEFQQQTSFLGSRRRTSSCFTTSARRGSRHSSTSSSTSSPKKKDKAPVQRDDKEEVDIDEDAFEALFAQLEEDLKNDNSFSNGSDDDDDITEEDLANLEKELEEALGDVDFEELSAPASSLSEDIDSDDEEEPEEVRPKLKNWQLRRLATALKIGRRKTNIKSFAAELGLDRAFVLELLREPPPNLLLLSASLPDNVVQQPTQIESKLVDPITPVVEATETDPEVKAPIHAMRTRWVEQKRFKKSQVQVLEKVYYRTKRPTNAMISSIVYVTNLPSKRIVKWFEDKRIEDGIPEKRQPFHRNA